MSLATVHEFQTAMSLAQTAQDTQARCEAVAACIAFLDLTQGQPAETLDLVRTMFKQTTIALEEAVTRGEVAHIAPWIAKAYEAAAPLVDRFETAGRPDKAAALRALLSSYKPD